MVKIRSVYCCLWIEGMIGKVSFWCTIVAIHHPLEGRSCPGIDATTTLLNKFLSAFDKRLREAFMAKRDLCGKKSDSRSTTPIF